MVSVIFFNETFPYLASKYMDRDFNICFDNIFPHSSLFGSTSLLVVLETFLNAGQKLGNVRKTFKLLDIFEKELYHMT